MKDNTQRFSDRVEDYIRHRPSYPSEVLGILQRETHLDPKGIIADIGSGTGKLTEVLLPGGNPMIGVEPNGPMRAASEAILGNHPNFRSVDGTAENTGLEDHSIDLITVGQAFHWFDIPACRKEFIRILKPEGWVALIWNRRYVEKSDFLDSYELILKTYADDYAKVRHQNIDHAALKTFFEEPGYSLHQLKYTQEFDFEGLKGRLMSSSYAPRRDHPNHAPMMEALKELFDQSQKNGVVQFAYDTQMYIGRLND